VALQSGLKQMGYDNVEQVRIGKYIELTITSTQEVKARQDLERICDQMLANPVIENYRFELIEVETQTGVF
jgi:phosphoribosylformylglycinamidine synthase